MIAGVASGLGTYFGIDPVIFRIGFAALTLAGGTGVLIYLLLWAVLPAVSYGGPGGQPPPAGAPRQGDAPIVAALRQGSAKSYLAVAAVILAVLLLIGPFTQPPVVLALLLIGVGVLLMVHDRPQHAGGAPPPWPPGRPAPPGGGEQPGEPGSRPGASEQPPHGQSATGGQGARGGQGAGGAPEAVYARAAQAGRPSAGSPGGRSAPAAPTQRRPPSALGWLTIAAALLATGVASALDNLGVVNLTPSRIVALVLTVIGVGLLVGSVWGRAWWLILLGILLVPVMAVASVASDVPVRGRTGTQFEQPASLAEVQPEYRLSGGQLTLDLRKVDFGPRAHHIRVRIGAGDLQVTLPADQPVTVTSSIAVGEMRLLGRPSNGGLQVEQTVVDGQAMGLGRLTLDLRVGVGQIVVTRGP